MTTSLFLTDPNRSSRYDVTKFAGVHPGGTQILLEYAGKDRLKLFFPTNRPLARLGAPKLEMLVYHVYQPIQLYP
jgi:cytochrome b involved in lipid metabolism